MSDRGRRKVANAEQLAILKSGVVAWNSGRQAIVDTFIDLSGADLIDAYLGEANLSGANLNPLDPLRAIEPSESVRS